MNNVTITGRAIKVNPAKEFTDKAGNRSLVAGLIMADKGGEIRVVLWGDLAGLVVQGKIKRGGIIRVHDGYVKEDLGGKTELHVGRKGRVEIEPRDVVEKDFPDKPSKPMKISEIKTEMFEVDIIGTVKTVNATRVVKTKDGKDVKVSSLILEDDSGATVRVVLWDDKTSSVENVKKGDNIDIASGRVRYSNNGEIEVHIGSGASVKVTPSSSAITGGGNSQITRIDQLKPGMRDFSTEGVLVGGPQFREFVRNDGTTGKVLSFELSDGTTSIRVVGWEETAENLGTSRRETQSGSTMQT